MPNRLLNTIVGGVLATLAFAQPVHAQPKPDAAKPDAAKPDAAKKAEGKPKQGEGAGTDEEFVLDDDDDDDDAEAEPERHERDPTPGEVAWQRKHERAQPRPPLPDEVDDPQPPPWERRLELGPDFAFVIRPLTDGLAESDISYDPAPAWGVHINWPIFKWVHFRPYFTHAIHNVDIPAGALTTDAANSIGADAVIDDPQAETFTLGAKLAPTLHFNDRVRAWLALGVGWGRFSFEDMSVTESDGGSYTIRDRSGVFVEFPLGVGISVDIIERWLLIGYEATAAPITGQSGDAHERFQAVDELGRTRDVGPFGAIELSVVQTLGVSLIL